MQFDAAGRQASRSCTRASRDGVDRGRAGRLGRRDPPARRAPSGSSPARVAAFEIDLDAVPEPAPVQYRDVTSFPAVREDLAVIVGEDVTAAHGDRDRRARRRAAARRRRGVRRVPRPRAARRGQRVTGAAAGLPRGRPHAHRCGGRAPSARRSSPRCPPSWEGGSVPPSAAVFGAAGYTGALTARLLYGTRHSS